MRLGLAGERQVGFSAEVALAVRAVAEEWGWSAPRVDTLDDERATDVVVAIGDVRNFPDLIRRSRGARRVLWHGETLPRRIPGAGGMVHELLPTGRFLDVVARIVPAVKSRPSFRSWREQAAIVREPMKNLRDLRRARSAFDRIVIDSEDRAEGARAAGIPVAVVPYGYHERIGGPFHSLGERDTQVLVLAHMVGGRRPRLLAGIETRLANHGIEVERVSAGIYGPERTRLMRRARVVLDIHRMPGNWPGFRFMVAAAAGAALVTEPLRNPPPLVADEHYVEAPAELLADALLSLLADEPRRRRLVEASQQLLAGNLAMASVLPRLLDVDGP